MRIYLHLGYPLTATTLLSHELFSKHTEINYLGVELSRYNEIVKYKKNNQILRIIFYIITHYSREDFDKSFQFLLQLFSDLQFDETKTNIIQCRQFLNPFRQTPGYAERDYINAQKLTKKQLNKPKIPYNNFYEQNFRFKKLIDNYQKKIDFKIFFFIRKQEDLLKSFYKHYNQDIHSIVNQKKTFKDAIKDLKNNNCDDGFKLFFDNFDYQDKYIALKTLYKEEAIKIFLYEKFNKEKKEFIDEFSNYLNIDPNQAYGHLDGKISNKVFRFKNNIFYLDSKFLLFVGYLGKFNFFKKIKNGISPFFKDFIKKIFAKELIDYNKDELKTVRNFFLKKNYEFSKDSKINIEKYGYFNL